MKSFTHLLCFSSMVLCAMGGAQADHLHEHRGQSLTVDTSGQTQSEYRACDLIPETAGFRPEAYGMDFPLALASDFFRPVQLKGAEHWSVEAIQPNSRDDLENVSITESESAKSPFHFASFRGPDQSSEAVTLRTSNSNQLTGTFQQISITEAVPAVNLEAIEIEPPPRVDPLRVRQPDPFRLLIMILLPPTLTVGGLLWWQTFRWEQRQRRRNRRRRHRTR